jgi:hypothetical protein
MPTAMWTWLVVLGVAAPATVESEPPGASALVSEPVATSEPPPSPEPGLGLEPPSASEPPPPKPPRFLEPQRLASRDRRPRGRTISRFTDRPPLIRPTLRVAPGFSARLTGPRYAAFGFDALASVMFGLHGGRRQWGLAPEVGYSLRVPRLEHRVLAGLGLVYGIDTDSWTVGWLPRVVVQPDAQAPGLGMRNGLWFNFAENGFSVELSHQWLQRGGAVQHELQVTLGVDLAMLAFVLTNARLAWL